MRRLAILTTLLLVGLTGTAQAANVLVGFRHGVSKQAALRLLQQDGASKVRYLGGLAAPIYSASLPVADQLAWSGETRYITANSQVTLADSGFTETNDPLYGVTQLWPLFPQSQTPGGGTGVASIWNRASGSGVVVAVVDSGVDLGHEDLAANLWTNPGETPGNGMDDDNDGYVDDVHGVDISGHDGDPSSTFWHGTHVSGIIAAVGDNGTGMVGAAPNAKLMIVQVMGDSGVITYSDAIAGIYYAIAHGARIINCSWGGNVDSPVLKQAIVDAGTKNVLVVAAVGNDGKTLESDPFYPATYDLPNEITVAASDNVGNVAPFSNYSPTLVDIAAPGAAITSTYPGNGYAVASGTSMATPLVSGVAADLLSAYPNTSAVQLKQAIVNGAVSSSIRNGKVRNAGLLSAPGALAYLDGVNNGTITTPTTTTTATTTTTTTPAPPLPGPFTTINPPTAFRLTGVPSAVLLLHWRRSAGTLGYRVIVDGHLVRTLPPSRTSYKYRFRKGVHSWGVIAFNKAGLRKAGVATLSR